MLYFSLQFKVFGLSVACAIIPMVYVICLVILIPESPMFYLMKGDIEKAQLSLKFFRGSNSRVGQELDGMQKALATVQTYTYNTYSTVKYRMNQ